MLSGSGVSARLAVVRAEYQALLAESLHELTVPELLDALNEWEVLNCRHPALEHRLVGELQSRTSAKELGAKNWADVLSTRLRISNAEARRRLNDAELLGPRTALTGEPLEPVLASVAAAQAAGSINAEHVEIVWKFFTKLPAWVDVETRLIAEKQLVTIAQGAKPQELAEAADTLALMIDQDGPVPDERERARKRFLWIGRQGPDGMVDVRGRLDPEAAATLEAVNAKLAAPGMCNPDDEHPCIDGTPDEDTVRRDTRTQGQRQHDAFKAIGRAVLASGQLGQHKGLPATIIVTTTLQELESGAGLAHTGGRTLLPMRDVIRLASQSHHYLVVYDGHTEEALYLGRAKRFASPGQRIVLYAKDRGCTRPGCTVPGYWCEVNHIDPWQPTGRTDITTLDLTCGPDNRLLANGGWTSRKRKDGRTQWTPPPLLDTGQPRINNYHHPQRYLLGNDEDDEPA